MTPEQAYLALAPLISGTSGWNDEAVRFYTSELTELSDPGVLGDACHDVLWAWKRGTRPPLAEIAESYHARNSRQLRENSSAGHRQLEAPAISLSGHLERLTRRAEAGNQAAVEELAIWTKHRNSPYVRALEPS